MARQMAIPDDLWEELAHLGKLDPNAGRTVAEYIRSILHRHCAAACNASMADERPVDLRRATEAGRRVAQETYGARQSRTRQGAWQENLCHVLLAHFDGNDERCSGIDLVDPVQVLQKMLLSFVGGLPLTDKQLRRLAMYEERRTRNLANEERARP